MTVKFRVISDVHIDINDRLTPKLYKHRSKNPVIDLIAGDISGYQDQAIAWLNKNIHHKGYFVEGNHIVYSDNDIRTLQKKQDVLRDAFRHNENIFYLENDCQEVADDVYIIGATLWTDFSLFLNNPGLNYDLDDYMWLCRCQMNDYRYGHYFDAKQNKNVNLLPEHTLREFEKSYMFIKDRVEKHRDSKIVILTHHAPSILSVPDKYKNSYISCAYASNLDEFIKSHENIKLWVHGHCHGFSDYMIGNCRVVCNPYGYRQYGEQTGYQRNFIVEI